MNTRMKVKKGTFKKSKKWYCSRCGNFTRQIPVEEVFSTTECTKCGWHNNPNRYDCPKCGAESDSWEMECVKGSECDKEYGCDECEYHQATSKTLISMGPRKYSYTEYYGCYDWTETHKCWNCGTVYEFDDSNC